MATGDKKQVVMAADRSVANGVATLGADALLAAAQRPKAGGLYRDDGKTTLEKSLTEISTTLQNKSSWSKNKISGSVLDWAAAQTIPTSGYAGADNTDVPKSGNWLVELAMSNAGGNWKAVILHGITEPGVWYRVYNYGSWNPNWRRLLDDRLIPADIGAYTKGEVDALVDLRRLYFVSGKLLDAGDDTTEGVGTATINIETNGIARIDFSIQIIAKGTASSFDFGINPALFTAKNANIPAITPVSGGVLVIISTSGSYGSRNGYGGTFQVDRGRWRPARMFNTDGDIGGWTSSDVDVGAAFVGTCYGAIG